MTESYPLPRDSPTAFAIAALGFTPHARQAEFMECRAKVKVAAAVRRFGKTVAQAAEALWFATVHPGTRQLLIAPTHDQAKLLWAEARRMAEHTILSGLLSAVVESPFPELRLAGRDAGGREVDSVIMARSVGTDARHIRGHGADRVVVDEAAFVPDSVLRQTVPPILAASPYGELVLLSTPCGISGVFYELWRRGMEGDPHIQSFHFPTSCNPAIAPEYLERQRQEMTERAFRTEYLAEFCDETASVFPWRIIQAALDPSIVAGAQEACRYLIGYDPARYSDRSGVVVLESSRLPYRVVEVRDISGRSYLDQARTIGHLAHIYHDARVVLDATSHDQLADQLRRNGLKVDAVRFTHEVKRELIDGLAIALEQGDLCLPQHQDLLRELQYYRYATTAAGTVKLGAPEGVGHFDDLVTALALAVHGSRRRPRVMTWA